MANAESGLTIFAFLDVRRKPGECRGPYRNRLGERHPARAGALAEPEPSRSVHNPAGKPNQRHGLQVQPNQSSTGNLPVFVKISFLPRPAWIPSRSIRQLGRAEFSRWALTAAQRTAYRLRCARNPTRNDRITSSTSPAPIGTSSRWPSLAGKTVNVLVTGILSGVPVQRQQLKMEPGLVLRRRQPVPQPSTEFRAGRDRTGFSRRLVSRSPTRWEFRLAFTCGRLFPGQEYLVRVETPGNENLGAGMYAVLEVELSVPAITQPSR